MTLPLPFQGADLLKAHGVRRNWHMWVNGSSLPPEWGLKRDHTVNYLGVEAFQSLLRSLFWFTYSFFPSGHKLSGSVETHSCCGHYSLLTLELSSSWHLTPFMMGSLPQGPCSSSHLSPLVTAPTLVIHSHVSSPRVNICVYNSARFHFSPGGSWLPIKSVMHTEVSRDRKYHPSPPTQWIQTSART